MTYGELITHCYDAVAVVDEWRNDFGAHLASYMVRKVQTGLAAWA